jgi:RHS repeat-associated protein
VWWDGDQSLVEERTAEGVSDVSNNGVVGNIHGLTLDEPLAVITDQTRIVNYNWRGLGKSSVFPNGQAGDNSLGNPATEIDWPAGTQAQTYFTPGPGSGSSNPKRWMGTFVANGQGTTGMLYRRNRYFNPGSGQFTQADPVGIAGGMNAFGFANGDPVNYGDPFGLCKDKDDPDCSVGAQVRANINATLSHVIAVVGNFGNSLSAALSAVGKGGLIQIGIAAATDGLGPAVGTGLKYASPALRELFANGSLRGASIIGIRSTLLEGGFAQAISENRGGYLFINEAGDEVRLMRRAGGWDARVMNKFGNNLDEFGNVARDPSSSHGISVFSK